LLLSIGILFNGKTIWRATKIKYSKYVIDYNPHVYGNIVHALMARSLALNLMPQQATMHAGPGQLVDCSSY